MAEDLQRPLQLPVVGQRPGVVLALVVRLPERQVPGAADPGRAPHVPPHLQPVDPAGGRGRPGQRQGAGHGPVGRPGGFVAPGAGLLVEVGGGAGRGTDEHGHRRALVDAVAQAAQPSVPPADHLGDQVDPRPGPGDVGGHVAPGTDGPAAATPGASTARRSAPPATAAATAPGLRPARASVPATAARRPPGPAAARSGRPCTAGSRPGRAASPPRRCSGRRR